MPLIACPHCAAHLNFPDGASPRQVQCPACRQVFHSLQGVIVRAAPPPPAPPRPAPAPKTARIERVTAVPVSPGPKTTRIEKVAAVRVPEPEPEPQWDEDDGPSYKQSVDRFLWARRGLAWAYLGMMALCVSLVLFVVAAGLAYLERSAEGGGDRFGTMFLRLSIGAGVLGFGSLTAGFGCLCAGPVGRGCLPLALVGLCLLAVNNVLMLPRVAGSTDAAGLPQVPKSYVLAYVPVKVSLDLFRKTATARSELEEQRRRFVGGTLFASAFMELGAVCVLLGYIRCICSYLVERDLRTQAEQALVFFPCLIFGIGAVLAVVVQVGISTNATDVTGIALTIAAFGVFAAVMFGYWYVMSMTRLGMEAADPRRW